MKKESFIRHFISILLYVCMSILITGCSSSYIKSADEGLEGEYLIDVSLTGGSGKAYVESPCTITFSEGGMEAEIVWSSKHYDYMIVDGVKYLRANEDLNIEGNSIFIIPIASLDTDIPVRADTTAMSKPHEIEYLLHFDSSTLTDMEGKRVEYKGVPYEGNIKEEGPDEEGGKDTNIRAGRESAVPSLKGIEITVNHAGTHIPMNLCRQDGSVIDFDKDLDIEYAKMFSAVSSDDGYAYIHTEQAGDYIVIPEGGQEVSLSGVCEGGSEAEILCKPFGNIYLVSSSAMDIFASLDEELKCLSFSGLDKQDWCVEPAVKAMDTGTLKYAGKYSAPDYELLLAGGCDLAIENTMIFHKPEVIEKLNGLGIPVMIEVSSYEPHPLGRMEWIKLYGFLTGQEEKAEKIFEDKLSEALPFISRSPYEEEAEEGPAVAFFYVTSNGAVNVRKSNDYISRMIAMAGGRYLPDTGEDDDNALSTVNMQMEAFYAGARDADILIYNGTISGEIGCIDDLIGKDKLFADFKAVKEGRVYTTDDNLYQKTMSIPGLIGDLDRILKNEDVSDKDLTFLKKVK